MIEQHVSRQSNNLIAQGQSLDSWPGKLQILMKLKICSGALKTGGWKDLHSVQDKENNEVCMLYFTSSMLSRVFT